MNSEKKIQMSKIDSRDSSEELNNLLAKIKDTIIASIVQGVDTLAEASKRKEDNISFETSFEAEPTPSTSNQEIVGESFIGAEEISSGSFTYKESTESIEEQEEPEGVSDKINRLEAVNFTIPTFGPPINSLSYWEISQPIVLSGEAWPYLRVNNEGVYLSKGFYKLDCTLANIHSGSGLGEFSQETKTLNKLITYIPNSGLKDNRKYVVRYQERKYLQVKSPVVLGLTNKDGVFRPKNFWGSITLIVHKLKTTPN